MMGRLYYDLTGLLHWYAYFRRPAGVQRVIEQVGRCPLLQEAAGRPHGQGHHVVFVVRLLGSDRFVRLNPGVLTALGEHRAATVRGLRALFARSLRLASARGLLREGRYFHLPYLAVGLSRTERVLGGWAEPPVSLLEPLDPPTAQDAFFSPGDLWWQPRYVEALASLKARTGVRILQMVHDLYVLEQPGWSPRGFSAVFARQLRGIAAIADSWLTSSDHVGRQVTRRLEGWSLPVRSVTTLPMGWDSFSDSSGTGPDGSRPIRERLGLRDHPYILFVGTIEPRKNVPALLDAMDALRREHGDRVPRLVVAGGYGWRASATRARLRRGHREGSLVWAHNLSDADLSALYRAARFTVMPSHGEGWGLAVQESLALGVPCIASSGGATREAGLSLATYVDPDRPDDLRRAMDAWIRDEAALDRARVRIREALSTGSLPTWNDAGRVLLKCAFPAGRV